MKRLRHIGFLLAALSAFSCGKPAEPLVTLLVPQIISTEVLPQADAVSLYASLSGPANLTSCGFGIVKDGSIREYKTQLNEEKMSFTAIPSGLEPNTEYEFYAFIANGTARIQTPERTFRTLAPTPPEPVGPSVSFGSVSAVPGTRSAILAATLSETQDVTAVGFSLSADGQSYQDFPASLSADGFSLTVDNLESNSEYLFYAWAVQRESRISSGVASFRTEKEVHTVSFLSLGAVPESFSVALTALIDDPTYVEYCGFGLSREGRTPVEYAATLDNSTLKADVGELLPDTDYTYYAFVVVDGSRITSDFSSFHTAKDTSIHIMDIGATAEETTVVLKARLTSTEGVIAAGFALASAGDSFEERAAIVQTDGRISLHWSDLSPDTLYRFYVWVQTAAGNIVSDILEFYTKKSSSADVSFFSVSAEVDGTSARLKAILSSLDGVSSTGFGISTTQYDYVEYSATLTEDGFQKALSGLQSGTTYYYYAFFTHGESYHRSDTFTFSIP